jgi:twitching motility protein PilT
MAQIDSYLRQATERGASDLHLSPGAPPMIRRHGTIVPLEGPRLTRDGLQLTLMEIADAATRARFEASKEAVFAYELPGVVRVRCGIYEQSRGLAGSFRLLPAAIPTLEDLGIPRGVGDLALRPLGLLVVCGPGASGRSSTLAALVDHVNHSLCCHVVTVEDPIEFKHASRSALVSQREVGRHVPSLAQGLRTALHGDSDVVMTAEPLEPESLETLLDGAGGRLVLMTLTASSAAHAVESIVDRFPPERRDHAAARLASVLVAVLRQRLVVRADGSGRVLALEVLNNTPAAAELVRAQRVAELDEMLRSGAPGMRPMSAAMHELQQAGLVGDPAAAPAPTLTVAEGDEELREAA